MKTAVGVIVATVVSESERLICTAFQPLRDMHIVSDLVLSQDLPVSDMPRTRVSIFPGSCSGRKSHHSFSEF